MDYLTSDWHIGHLNVIRYDQRPYLSLQEMHEDLIRNYNDLVKPDDTCYFLGDILWNNLPESREVIKQLNGTKILIPGNHDNKNTFDLFEKVIHKSMEIKLDGVTFSLSHCPLMGETREELYWSENWHSEKEFGDKYSAKDNGQFHFHGHIHADGFDRIYGRQLDVGVRANKYRPIALKKACEELLKYNGVLKKACEEILNYNGGTW